MWENITFYLFFRDEAKLIMALAKSMGLTGREFVWVLSQSIVGDIEKMKPKEFPIGLFGNTLKNLCSTASKIISSI